MSLSADSMAPSTRFAHLIQAPNPFYYLGDPFMRHVSWVATIRQVRYQPRGERVTEHRPCARGVHCLTEGRDFYEPENPSKQRQGVWYRGLEHGLWSQRDPGSIPAQATYCDSPGRTTQHLCAQRPTPVLDFLGLLSRWDESVRPLEWCWRTIGAPQM